LGRGTTVGRWWWRRLIAVTPWVFPSSLVGVMINKVANKESRLRISFRSLVRNKLKYCTCYLPEFWSQRASQPGD
jgi:hypothetical protein